MAAPPPFQRLEGDRAEETAIKSGVVATSPAAPGQLGVLRVTLALAASSSPLLIALACRHVVPGAVADAMGKSAIASAAMLLCSLVGYGVTVPTRLLAAFQHLAAGLLVSSVSVELVPTIMSAPNDLRYNAAIVFGFIGGTAAFFALGAFCGAPEDEESEAEDGTPATTPRGITKLSHVQRASQMVSPPYPGALVAAVLVDSAVDGLLIGLASASATEVPNAGVVLAIALAIEMGFTGLAYAATLRKQASWIGLLSIAAPPFVLLGASTFGAGAASFLLAYPVGHVAVVSFGSTALLYLVVVELLREAHEGMGESATVAIEVMFFVGFFLAVLLERALEE